MTTIAKFVAELGLNPAGLSSGLRAGATALQSFQRDAVRTLNGVRWNGAVGAKQQGAEMAAQLIAGLTNKFESSAADAREALFQGMISPAEFRRRGVEAAREFNAGVTSGIKHLGDSGGMTSGVHHTLVNSYKEQGLAQDPTKRLDEVGSKMQRTGAMMTAAVTVPIVAAGVGIAKLAADYEASMNLLEVRTHATGTEFAALGKLARRLGADTQFSASDAADAMSYLAQAGLGVNQILTATPHVLTLAASANVSMADAANTLTSILQGSGIAITDLAHANDVLVAATNTSKVNLVDLGTSLKYAGSITHLAGISFEETTAALALMARTGYDAASGGTALRNVVGHLLNPSKEAARTIERLGLNAAISNGKIKSLAQVVGILEKSGATTADMLTVFGERAGPAMAGLVSQGTESLVKMTATFNAAGGMAKSVADVQMRGLRGAMRALESSVEELQIRMAESGFIGVLVKVINYINALIDVIGRLPSSVLATISVVLAFAAAVGPVLLIMGTLARTIAAVRTAFAALAAAEGLGAVALSLTGVVGIVIALVAAFAALRAVMKKDEDQSKDFGSALRSMSKDQIANVIADLKKTRDAQAAIVKTMETPSIGAAPAAVANTAGRAPIAARGSAYGTVTPAQQFEDRYKRQAAVVGVLNTQLEIAERALSDVTRSQDALTASAAETTRAIMAGVNGVNSVADSSKVTQEALKALGDRVTLVRSNVESMAQLGTPLPGFNDQLLKLWTDLNDKVAEHASDLSEVGAAYRDLLGKFLEVKFAPGSLGALLSGQMPTPKIAQTATGPGVQPIAPITRANVPVAPPPPIAVPMQGIAGDIMSVLGDAFAGIGEGISSMLMTALGPMALLAAVLQPIIPVLEILLVPLQMLGQILASFVLPVIKLLFPIFKAVAIAASYLAEIISRVTAGIATTVGTILAAIGAALNKIPFLHLGNGLESAGNALKTFGANSYAAAAAMKAGREELQALSFDQAAAGIDALGSAAQDAADSVRNLPSWYRVEGAIFGASAARPVDPASVGGVAASAAPAMPSFAASPSAFAASASSVAASFSSSADAIVSAITSAPAPVVIPPAPSPAPAPAPVDVSAIVSSIEALAALVTAPAVAGSNTLPTSFAEGNSYAEHNNFTGGGNVTIGSVTISATGQGGQKSGRDLWIEMIAEARKQAALTLGSAERWPEVI